MRACDGHRGLDHLGLRHERQDAFHRRTIELAAEQLAQLRIVGGLQRVDHRQRVHAFVHVVADRLAELGFRARDVEHVVDDLEAHPEVHAELGERVERVGGDVAHHAAHPACRGHE